MGRAEYLNPKDSLNRVTNNAVIDLLALTSTTDDSGYQDQGGNKLTMTDVSNMLFQLFSGGLILAVASVSDQPIKVGRMTLRNHTRNAVKVSPALLISVAFLERYDRKKFETQLEEGEIDGPGLIKKLYGVVIEDNPLLT